jgi:acyl-CoA reductase-like NAD-dependent aldehyde dehydrogenase
MHFLSEKKDIQKRAEYLYHVAHVFRQDKQRDAKVITNEMGKAIREAR